MAGNAAPQALSESDLKMFARFGIEPFLLADAHVCRVTDLEALESYGIRFDGNKTGIVFPYFDPVSGGRWTARLRRDNPEINSEGKAETSTCPPGETTGTCTSRPALGSCWLT
jgi:hypothetical protein